ASKQPTKLVNWINSDIDSDKLGNIMILPDGRVLCVSHNYGMNGNSKSEFIILTKTDSAQIKPKTKLTLATMWMSSELRGAVLQFNKTNQDYRIEVQDYSEFNTKDDYEAGRLKLNTAIISGNVPDLVDVNQMPMQQYVAKGLMEDLYPYIDKDTEVSRDDLVQSVFRSLEINGGLYQVSPSFSVSSVVGATSLVGPDMGWTIDDLMAVREKMPEGNTVFNYLTRDSMLYSMCVFGMDDYVNWETGECHFDSDTFIKMLEFANTFPVEYNWEDEETNSVSEFEKIKSGQVFLSAFNLYDFQEYQTYQAMYGGDITYIGFPRATGIGNAVSVNAGLAMSSKCAHKEAAWEFMRIFLTEKYQKENIWWGLPTNKNIFDLKLADAMKTEEEKAAQQAASNSDMAVSIGGSVMMGDGLEVKIHPMTQPEKDKIMAMVDALDSTVNYDQSMMEIIQEESAAFFAGQKTAAETAGIIQSRVKIYVNEQK
ncbi:MAG: extracellular solute-binding protein, partial [Clostridiales bacterium]